MRKINQIKIAVLLSFVGAIVAVLLTDNFVNQTSYAYSSGPPAGYTGAPGEFTCTECHLVEDAGNGKLSLTVPPTYVPGRTYQITVKHANADQTRIRWGFELTALSADRLKAGELASTDATTQLTTGGPDNKNPRQYIEHTAAGNFEGQKNGAMWTFNWTAPATDVGPVTFYVAGNQANGNHNSSGDYIYSTFASSDPDSTQAEYAISASPSPLTISPGGTGTFNLSTTPLGDFQGAVTFTVGGLPGESVAAFDPPAINFNNPFTINSTLRVATGAGVPPGAYPLTITGIGQNIKRTTTALFVVTGTPAVDLSITKTGSPNPALVGANLSYRITVGNNGPSPANNVIMTNKLPANVAFVSASAGQGSCTASAAAVTCNLGSLARGASTLVALTVKPTAAGNIGSLASVVATETDTNIGNNSATDTINSIAGGAVPSLTDPNLAVRTVATGLSSPTTMAFLSANDFFVLEKTTGKVQHVVSGQLQSAALDLAVNSASERGLLGIALHPNFAANHYVYLYWTESSTGADSENLEDVPVLGNRVDRYVWDGSALIYDRNLIKLRAFQSDAGQPLRGNHNGGVIRFGPDGRLYIMIGDNGRRGSLQNLMSRGPMPDDQFGGPAPDDAHLTGVVLRLNDDGTTPSDNPFYSVGVRMGGAVGANIQKVFAYGVRNGFGMAFDPQTGALWTQENGDDSYDEINRIEAGANNGWAQVMGPLGRVADFKAIETNRPGGLQQNRWPAANLPDTPAEALARLYMLAGAHYNEPEFSWRYAVAPSPIGFVKGLGLGPQFEGDMFVGASRPFLYGGYLFRMKLSADRRSFVFNDQRLADKVADNDDKFDITESESLLIGKDFGVTTDIQTGPNGNLYIVSLSNNAVYEIYSNAKLYYANLTNTQEVPQTDSKANATATILLSPDETTAVVSLAYGNNLTAAQTATNIHGPAAIGANAPVIFNLSNGALTGERINLTPGQVADLKAGLYYININTSAFPNGEIRGQFVAAPQTNVAQFGSATYTAAENAGAVQVSVMRLGDASAAASVTYETSDASLATDKCDAVKGTASSRCDYLASGGTIVFAAGETRRTIAIPIVDDAYAEGAETFTVKLTGAAGAALNSAAQTSVVINDNDATTPAVNPESDATFFVRQQYLDFLGREPDAPGLAFWTSEITMCGTNAACVDRKRVNTSGAFFLSSEFQSTGFFVYRLYKGALGRVPLFDELILAMRQVGAGIVVGDQLSPQIIEDNKTAYANAFVMRDDFKAKYGSLNNQQYVDKLFGTTGASVTAADKIALVNDLNNNTETRASVLRKICDGTVTQSDGTQAFSTVYGKAFFDKEFNTAFVLMQYIGYLRRDPDDGGFAYWLAKLNLYGNFTDAEMVRSFLLSDEYRSRFGAAR